MPRTIPLSLLAAVLAALLLAAGCATVVQGGPVADPAPAPTEGPGSDPVVWMDKVCAAVLTFSRPILAEPGFGAAPDLPSVKQTFSDYLGGVVAGVQQSQTELAAVGRSPVPSGDETVARLREVLQRLELDFSQAKATVDAADVSNPQGFVATLTELEGVIGSIDAPDALTDLSVSPRLERAAGRAPNCQELDRLEASLPG